MHPSVAICAVCDAHACRTLTPSGETGVVVAVECTACGVVLSMQALHEARTMTALTAGAPADGRALRAVR